MIGRRMGMLKSLMFNSLSFSNNKQGHRHRNKVNKVDEATKLQIIQKNQILERNIKRFVQQFQLHAELVKNSPSSFTSLFARSCLIASRHIPYQKYYPIIKKSINSKNFQLTPHICTSLTECFAQLKFQGDQNNLIKKLFHYYQENHSLFTQNQEIVFWENYLKIMGQKVHSSIKFINLNRKQSKTIQYSSIKQIVQKSIRIQNVNRKMISKIIFQNKNQMVMSMRKNGSSKEIILRVKVIDDFDKYSFNKGDEQEDKVIINSVIKQISFVRSKVKKGWNIFFHGNLLMEKQQNEKYIYTNKKADGTDLQYIKTQKVQQKFEISEQYLNNHQNLNQLRISNRYIKGIFYKSTNPNNKQIDIITTLILGAGTSIKTVIRHFQQNGKQSTKQNIIIHYLSIDQLKQCCGYSKLSQFHWQLFQSYIEVQNYRNKKYKEENERKYGLSQIMENLQNKQITKQQAQFQMISRSNQMAEMNVKRANQIQNVRFQYEYNKDYKRIYSTIGNYGQQLFWQMRPFFNDTTRIMNSIDQLIDNSKQEKNVKILLITKRQNIPHLIRNITSLKYWTVPQLKSTNPNQIIHKYQILNQILTSTRRNYK